MRSMSLSRKVIIETYHQMIQKNRLIPTAGQVAKELGRPLDKNKSHSFIGLVIREHRKVSPYTVSGM